MRSKECRTYCTIATYTPSTLVGHPANGRKWALLKHLSDEEPDKPRWNRAQLEELAKSADPIQQKVAEILLGDFEKHEQVNVEKEEDAMGLVSFEKHAPAYNNISLAEWTEREFEKGAAESQAKDPKLTTAQSWARFMDTEKGRNLYKLRVSAYRDMPVRDALAKLERDDSASAARVAKALDSPWR